MRRKILFLSYKELINSYNSKFKKFYPNVIKTEQEIVALMTTMIKLKIFTEYDTDTSSWYDNKVADKATKHGCHVNIMVYGNLNFSQIKSLLKNDFQIEFKKDI